MPRTPSIRRSTRSCSFFFFQAEDGIRDWSVTGVQTCALPIFAILGAAWPATVRLVGLSLILSYLIGLAIGVVQAARSRSRTDTFLSISSVEIGRASCRERV